MPDGFIPWLWLSSIAVPTAGAKPSLFHPEKNFPPPLFHQANRRCVHRFFLYFTISDTERIKSDSFPDKTDSLSFYPKPGSVPFETLGFANGHGFPIAIGKSE
jgi:hypothetical protein